MHDHSSHTLTPAYEAPTTYLINLWDMFSPQVHIDGWGLIFLKVSDVLVLLGRTLLACGPIFEGVSQYPSNSRKTSSQVLAGILGKNVEQFWELMITHHSIQIIP